MKKIVFTLSLFLVSTLLYNQAFAQCRVSQTGNGTTNVINGIGTIFQQFFTPSCTDQLNSVQFNIVTVNTTGDVVVSIGTGDEGSFVSLDDETVAISSTGLLTVNFSTTPTLTSAIEYTLQVSRVGSTDVEFEAAATANVNYDSGTGSESKGFGFGSWSSLGRQTLFQAALNTTLPVEFSAFEARQSGNKIALDWSTASEVNNAGFEVQRSRNGADFERIAWIDGTNQESGSASYTYQDEIDPVRGNTVYYRLRQIDFDGQFSFSNTSTVELDFVEAGLNKMLLRPNAVASGESINLIVPEACQGEAFSVEVINLMGQRILQTKMGNACQKQITLQEAGLYYVQLRDKLNQVREVQKVLIR